MLQPLRLFRFGGFVLDCAQRRLLQANEELYLPPKTFDLLLYLIQNRGRVIAKEELLDAVWPGVTVGENTLSQRIREVRDALGDEPSAARFVKTIPRIGYQFISEVDEERPEVSPAHTSLRARRPGARARYLFVIAAVIGGALLAFFVRAGSAPLRISHQRLISDFPGSPRFPSLSPDGGTMVYVDDADGRPQLWIKSVSGGGSTQLTFLDGFGAGPPRWSPEGDEILFDHAGGIWSVSRFGGAPRRIIESGRNPSLSSDGRRLAYEGLGISNDDRAIWIANRDGTARRRVFEQRYPLAAMPALSADGKSIVFYQTDGGPMGDLWIIPSTGGQLRRLTFDDAEVDTPIWTPDSRFILFSSRRAGSRTLWRISADGGNLQPVTSGAGEDSHPQISSDGKRLIYSNTRNRFSLVLMDASTGSRRTLLERRTLISGPRFSPNGDRLAFFHELDTGIHLFTTDLNGREPRQITSRSGERNLVPQWSPGGDALLFSQVRPKDSYRRVSVSGGESTEVAPWPWYYWVVPDPQVRAIAYRPRAPASLITVIRQLQSGVELPLEIPLNNFRWSHDGRTVFGTQIVRRENSNTWNVVSCVAATGACKVLTSGHGAVPSPDGQRLYFMRPATGGLRGLWCAGIDGRDERYLGEIGPFRLPDVVMDVSPNQLIAWPTFYPGKSEIWVAELR
jgi:Tol biopolymer transport system component/DNA-binding winged helix-turn-helix (wHTH) protein